MKKKRLLPLLGLILLFSCTPDKYEDYTIFVDPFIGTGGHGHTYPGATWPFGMVQLSPDTRLSGWDGCSGYHYSDHVIYGFSHTHLSGTGVPDYGDILLMPTIGKIHLNNGSETEIDQGYGSRFRHETEMASPGYYAVRLDDYQVDVELTVTPRTGFHKYIFPATDEANIILDLEHRDKVIESEIRIINDHEIEGFRRSDSWAKDQHIYFIAQFSQPFDTSGIAMNDKILNDTMYAKGNALKAFFRFNTQKNQQILVKVGISAVSIEGARKNLDYELHGWNFNVAKKVAHEAWHKVLKKIKVKGGTTEQKKTFYTALYHAFLAPNLFMDVDGQYRGTDLNIHTANNFTNYTVFSLWDTFRAEHPLFTILEEKRTVDFIKTMLAQYKNGGQLPVWELAGNYTGCMIGYHSIPVIVDAYMKGIRDFDASIAMNAMKHSAEQEHLGLKYYKKKGYIPSNKEGESVSKTLEYAYDDWCISQMAKEMGEQEEYEKYIRRAQNYKNIFDPSTGFMRAKVDGFWFEPFDPAEVNFNYTEANSWQYSFYVPQDIEGIISLMGGKNAFEKKLDDLFTADSKTTGREQSDITGLIGQYAHGNEPSHHMAYLYNYVNKPWKTQEKVREIMDNLYSAEPDGLCGNEDCGQMSAWYVMSAMGLYPVCPGQEIYAIGSPLFNEMVISLENGKTFTIIALHNSQENKYIQSASLNNEPYEKSFIRHSDIMQGGKLVFKMGSKPVTEWATADDALPYSAINDELISPMPYIEKGSPLFIDSTEVVIKSTNPEATIYYTLDGSPPEKSGVKYTSPLLLTNPTTLMAISRADGLPDSFTMEANFYELPKNRKIVLHTPYSGQYAAGGDHALIDQLRGGNDFKTGRWQGYQGVDLNAVIDLGERQYIKRLALSCLQDNNSWIFMPPEVNFYVSNDGNDFSLIETVNNTISSKAVGVHLKEYEVIINSKIRYIKVIAKNIAVCPGWHKGVGNKAWIFADEIIIE